MLTGWGLFWAQTLIGWNIVLDKPPKPTIGDTLALRFQATIPGPYHLFSSRAPAKEANLPTTLTLEKLVGLRPLGGLKEQGHLQSKYDEIFETEVYYYEGKAEFLQYFRIEALPAEVGGYLRYQYCDAQQCYMETKDFHFKLSGGLAAKPQVSSGPLSPRADTLPKPKADSTSLSPRIASPTPPPPPSVAPFESLWWVFLKAFFFGLAAILTPCTFPMIPLTLSYFTKATEGRRGFPFLALWYAFSVLLIFWLIGLLLTLVFGASAAYNLATNPWLNLLFFFILLLFGLSFLGLYDIVLPATWSTATSRRANPHSLAGVFFMALTLVLVSFSCIGPLIGTLMIDMVGGKLWEPMVGMTGFGLAFALPFGLLAGMPQLLHRLPRAGDWMETFKVTLGFLELALALKFLSNADLVWHLGLLPREVYLVLWITLFLFLSLYLLGKIPLKGAAPSTIGVGRLLLSMGSFSLALYLFTGLWGAPLKLFSGLLPPVHEEMGVRVLGAERLATPTCFYPPNRKYADKLRKYTPVDLCAFYDLEEALAYASQVRKPLLLDFTGHTCTNCRQVESNVWSHPHVAKHLREDVVLVSLFVDDLTPLDTVITLPEGKKLRTLGDKWLYLQKTRYNTQAQPYYVITDSTLVPLTAPLGFTLDVGQFLSFLQEGLSNYQKRYGV
ncbi:MAG: thioredoxin family protein [Bacteroidia bacterium]|nr:thioredoxin family protein [Bacteroidia bacterium]MDW8088568.1 cytochrome c biogenesis protein CcdA [Bacteroidia bacterium]